MFKVIKKYKLAIILIIYIIITFTTILFHEKWRDESQAWLIARDLNIVDIIKQMKYEGHSFLWYMILVPFAKLGFPYITENLISLGIVTIAAWLILKKAPFSLFTKILILASYPMSYLYPVIARNYCLIPLAIVLIAIYYPKRKEKPIQYALSILLLANSHGIMLGLVGMLYLFFYVQELFIHWKEKSSFQKKQLIISLIISILGIAVIVAIILIGMSTNIEVKGNSKFSIEKLKNILIVFKNLQYNIFGSEPQKITSIVISIYILFLGIFVLAYEVKKYPQNAIIILVSVLFQLYVYLQIYGISAQRANAILFIILLFVWIQREETQSKTKNRKYTFMEIVGILFLMQNCVWGVFNITQEYKQNYSSAKQAAEYIMQNIEKDAIFICTDRALGSAIIPYTDRNNFWSPQIEDYFTFVTWDDTTNKKYAQEEIQRKVAELYKQNKKLYFIYSGKWDASVNWDEYEIDYMIKNGYIEELYKTDNAIKVEERYTIYRITEDYIYNYKKRD